MPEVAERIFLCRYGYNSKDYLYSEKGMKMKRYRMINAVALIVCVAMAFFVKGTIGNTKEKHGAVTTMAVALTTMALPMIGTEEVPQRDVEPVLDQEPEPEKQPETEGMEDVPQEEPEPEPEKVPVADSITAPQVLIYHTHATETYQPVTEGNFHSVAKTGTVREVGDVLAQRLTELGFEVIHDETIHDHPSYNQSYSRSLETAKGYLDKYPGIRIVVDLHRDAAGYTGNVGKTVAVDGKIAASYGYVIGQGNPNVTALTETVNRLNRISEEKYPEFTGRIIEKEYKFNQYISDQHVLIEVGNNENTIEQAKLTGYYLAEVIGAFLKEE